MLRVVHLNRWVVLGLLLAAGAAVCPAQLLPFSTTNYAAKVITQTGQVSIVKDTQPWALSVGDSVQVRDLILTGVDGHALLQVSDGSTFEVFPNSRVVFRKNPPNWRDFLDVLVGRVRVHIEHLGNVPNPNRVLTPTAVISVRGTTFEISVNDDDETTLVEVEDGQVEVQHALLPRGNSKILNPGESLRVYRDEPIARNFDKGNLARRILHSMSDAALTMATRMPSSGGVGGTTGASGGAGDTTKVPPPPPPPTPSPAP
ncbi:MAG: FecR domain-containing protein, partial [Acidobacteriota bacterium]|nr:FecR domain-containing protein [Acidobacteriota bacterium]